MRTLVPQTRFVLIMGYARAGKDTAAQGLVRELGFVRHALADSLKEMALSINPHLTCGHLAPFVGEVGWEAAKSVPSVREFLQRLGTEGIRKFVGEDFWAKHLLARTHGLPLVVVPDVRFSNELWMLRDGPGRESLTIWVNRDGCVEGSHASERTLSPQDADFAVKNNGSESDLQDMVVSYARDYFSLH